MIGSFGFGARGSQFLLFQQASLSLYTLYIYINSKVLMKKNSVILSVILTCVLAVSLQTMAATEKLRIMTYNIPYGNIQPSEGNGTRRLQVSVGYSILPATARAPSACTTSRRAT